MNSSPFDFDVVTGPPEPRDEPKAAARPAGGLGPQAGAPPADPIPSK